MAYNISQNQKSKEIIIEILAFSWGGRWDSNPRHSEPQSDALTN